MAKKVTIELVDDISGESGATTTQFGLDGIEYEIDLVNDKALREQFAPWIAKSRRVNGHGQNGSLPTNGRHRHDMHLIRVWAKQNNITVPARGRMPAAIIEAYDKAQSAKQRNTAMQQPASYSPTESRSCRVATPSAARGSRRRHLLARSNGRAVPDRERLVAHSRYFMPPLKKA